MSVKLSFGNPVVIASGPSFEEIGWGPYQFPAVQRMPDGRLVCNYHMVDDTTEAYGLERGWAVSEDNGQTWKPLTSAEEIAAFKPYSGLKLPDGTYLRVVTPRPVPISDELHAELKKKMGCRKFCLGIEEIPDGIIPKYKWPLAKFDPATGEDKPYLADVEWPGMTCGLTTGAMINPVPFATAHVGPDGVIYQSHYGHGRNPENLGFTSYYACYFFTSTDGGASYQLKSWIHYLPDTNEFKDAFVTEGFCEPDFCFMPDGSIIMLMRTGSFTPSYITRSTDMGATWSKPVKFDKCGVFPHLLHLDCGVTIASYGRPGLFVRATEDPSGLAWDEPYELMPYDAPHTSCYYTDLIAIDERTALMFYSDWSSGHKSICCRTITVEK